MLKMPRTREEMLRMFEANEEAETAEERATLAKERTKYIEPSKEELQEGAEADALGVALAKKEEERRGIVERRYQKEQRRAALAHIRARHLQRIDRRLLATAPEDIRATRAWIDEEIEATTQLTTSYNTEDGGIGADGGAYRLATHSTRASINARLTYLRDARRYDLPEIALLPDPADVAAACDEIRENVPAIEMQKLSHRRVV